MNDRERDRKFKAERQRQLRSRARLQRETLSELKQLMQKALRDVKAVLSNAPTDWEQFYLPQMQRAIVQGLNEINEQLTGIAGRTFTQSVEAGIALIDSSFAAAEIQLSGVLPNIDVRQLTAVRNFMTERLRDVTLSMANRINNELGLVAIGAQPTSQAITNIANIVQVGGRTRATTILRTELGRAYSIAAHERQSQASEILPGLKKQWRRSGKIHSRLNHDAADGQVQEVDQPFLLGGVQLMFPRDPKGPVKEIINCGCESLPFMEHWEVSNPGAV